MFSLIKARGTSSGHVEQLTQTQLQSSIFRSSEAETAKVDFQELRRVLRQESHIPEDVADSVLIHIQDNIDRLGLQEPGASIILNWLTGLLREKGYGLDAIPIQSLELSLNDVELNIYHPVGAGAGAEQNPEATSQALAQRLKTQFACRRVYQEDVIAAHDAGDIELLHLGAVDRPHDVFLTPDYIKIGGLKSMHGAPNAGPAMRAEVLLAHLIRFTHELQNHFAGDICWGYFNTLLLPYTADMSDEALLQFIQQLLFEFAQLDIERGGLNRQVILDFDFDLPRQLRGVPAIGPGGEVVDGKTYADYIAELQRFNEAVMQCLEKGDARGCPFHSPQIIYHFNDSETPWSDLKTKLTQRALEGGNPSLSDSTKSRILGPLGQVSLKDPDFLKQIQHPADLRGFSSSSVALNVARLASLSKDDKDFRERLDRVLDLVVSAHRQKRLFLSRLMAYGNRGPLQFLRRKVDQQPFVLMKNSTQPLAIVGLGEAATIRNGGQPNHPATFEAVAHQAYAMLSEIHSAINARNEMHKLRMLLTGVKGDVITYRFAALDLKHLGREHAAFMFHHDEQTHPIYSDGPNIFAFQDLPWRKRLKLEAPLHPFFSGQQPAVFYLHQASHIDPGLAQRILAEAAGATVQHVQFAPDLHLCLGCGFIFEEKADHCPDCGSSLISDYGLCQTHFSPVRAWCLGKRSEWRIRHRIDTEPAPVQQQLPW
jgi:ribonucleoside-triphosphate reductase